MVAGFKATEFCRFHIFCFLRDVPQEGNEIKMLSLIINKVLSIPVVCYFLLLYYATRKKGLVLVVL